MGIVIGLSRWGGELVGKPPRSWDPPVFIGVLLWRGCDATAQLCDSMQENRVVSTKVGTGCAVLCLEQEMVLTYCKCY